MSTSCIRRALYSLLVINFLNRYDRFVTQMPSVTARVAVARSKKKNAQSAFKEEPPGTTPKQKRSNRERVNWFARNWARSKRRNVSRIIVRKKNTHTGSGFDRLFSMKESEGSRQVISLAANLETSLIDHSKDNAPLLPSRALRDPRERLIRAINELKSNGGFFSTFPSRYSQLGVTQSLR